MRWIVDRKTKNVVPCCQRNIQEIRDSYHLIAGHVMFDMFISDVGGELTDVRQIHSEGYKHLPIMTMNRKHIPEIYRPGPNAVISAIENVRFRNVDVVKKKHYTAYEFDVIDCYGGSIPGVALVKPIGMGKLRDLSEPFDNLSENAFFLMGFVPVYAGLMDDRFRVCDDSMRLFLLEACPRNYDPNGGEPLPKPSIEILAA